jgi:hypothetical protein
MADAPRPCRLRSPFGRYRDLRTAPKLLVAFLPVCALLLAVGLMGVDRLPAAHERLDGRYRHESLHPIAGGERAETFAADLGQWIRTRDDELVPLAQTGRTTDLSAAIQTDSAPPFERTDTALDGHRQSAHADAQARPTASDAASTRTRTLAIGALLLALLVAVAVGRLVPGPLNTGTDAVATTTRRIGDAHVGLARVPVGLPELAGQVRH